MTKQIQVAIDCVDPARLAQFWAEVLGYQMEAPPAGYPSWSDFSRAAGVDNEEWNAVTDPAGVGPRMLFHSVPETKTCKNRLHLDVRTAGPRGTPIDRRRPRVDAEVVRLLALGAKHVRTVEDDTDYFALMQDPEGNEFCVC